MDAGFLWDARSALIVLGGTLVATVLRAGVGNCILTARALLGLAERQTSAWQMRADLAGKVEAIRRDGPLRAELDHLTDPEFEDATGALIRHRSIAALLERHETYRAQRERRSKAARETLIHAAELGPVMGLAGTLISLATLRGGGMGADRLGDAIGMAVATTLYGLIVAHFIFAPLAEILSRRAGAEERARQEVIDWLAEQLGPAFEKKGTLPHGVEAVR